MDLQAKLFIYFYIAFNCVMAEFTEEQLELMKNLHNECVGQTGVNEDYLQDCAKGIFRDDPKLKCYSKCIFEELGTIQAYESFNWSSLLLGLDEIKSRITNREIKDDGTIDSEGLLAVMPDDIREKIGAGVRKCGTIVGSDICDTVYLTNQCYYKEFPNDFFVI